MRLVWPNAEVAPPGPKVARSSGGEQRQRGDMDREKSRDFTAVALAKNGQPNRPDVQAIQ